MRHALSTLVVEHDPKLVVLAALICLLGTATAIRLFVRTRGNEGGQFWGWLFLTGVAAGATIWTTHFIAMLAYRPGVATGYDPLLTVASLFLAIATTGIGFAVAATSAFWRSAEVGGAIVGLGIAGMHFTGMAAFRAGGVVHLDATLTAASILFGAALAAAALHQAAHGRRPSRYVESAGLLAGAIVALHFIAMGAMHIMPDPGIIVPGQLISNTALSVGVAGATLLVIGTGVVATLIDDTCQAEARDRMRELADATVEGVVVTDGRAILDVNKSFEAMCGRDRDALVGTCFYSLVASATAEGWGPRRARFETELFLPGGKTMPVEIVAREMSRHRPRRIFAVRDLTERRNAESRIHYLAHHDPLTRLPNRASLLERLSLDLKRAAGRGEPLAVLCLDLDRFKEVNDVFGHSAGDEVLVETARRMRQMLVDGEFLARLGGDEFMVLQQDAEQPRAAHNLANRLLSCVQESFLVAGQTTHIGMSIGVALYPRDAKGADQLMANADVALYRAKAEEHGHVCFFEKEMDEAVRRRRSLAQELKQAIECAELEVHYQAQAEVATSQIVGYEALVRWRHPLRGLVMPGEFIPLAEETGLILPIGEWVLRTACINAASWDSPMRVSVNLSPVQFTQRDLPERIHRILLESGLAPHRLELEVTETALIRDLDRSLHVLRRLKALGVSVAMDDFGTGYSSLSTLQAFPFDKIKIDPSFIATMDSHPQAAVIVRSVIGLGHSLGIPVLAEGVETDAQFRRLAAEGCEEAQGYLLGGPLPLSEIASLSGLGKATAESAPPNDSLPLKKSA